MLRAFQVAWLVTSCEVPSLYTATAESCLLCPDAIENTAGVIVIDETEDEVTATVALPETPFIVAITVTLPALRLARRPAPPTVATVGSEVVQVTWEVRFCVLLSE